MPTYEYECSNCGKVFELFQSITEPPRRRLRKTDPRPCKCNATVTRRISTGGGLIFKGSGFYLTDYRSESYKQAAKADSGAGDGKVGSDGKTGGDGKGGGETKAESKTASSEKAEPARKAAKKGKSAKKE